VSKGALQDRLLDFGHLCGSGSVLEEGGSKKSRRHETLFVTEEIFAVRAANFDSIPAVASSAPRDFCPNYCACELISPIFLVSWASYGKEEDK
jgi:hypothetical protein